MKYYSDHVIQEELKKGKIEFEQFIHDYIFDDDIFALLDDTLYKEQYNDIIEELKSQIKQMIKHKYDGTYNIYSFRREVYDIYELEKSLLC